jgi:outer membrane receptor protein involved in Fe transport
VKLIFLRASRMLLAFALALSCGLPSVAIAQSQYTGALAGTVVDATTGVPISGVDVTAVGTHLTTKTDGAGHFQFDKMAPRRYVLSLKRNDYQPGVSEPITVNGQLVRTTLSLHRATSNLHTIAETSSRASDSLEQASTFTKTVNTEQLDREGITRIADALRTLPGVNNGITGDTASLADDVNLNIRGIGTLETEAAIDGHPIAYGIKGGYNYNLSPVYPYQSATVLYGSASNLVGVDAIGGVVDFRTLDPTPTFQTSITQGFGSFNQLSTSLRSTGTEGKLGFALAYGVGSLDGPFRNANFYQPGAAFDQSVLSGPIHDLGVYNDDSTTTTRGGLVKLDYNFDPKNSVTYTMVTSSRWEDKTGNGDGDFLPYSTALARGSQQLAAYTPGTATFKCPKGTFPATNALGLLNGFGPNGQPDGGITCQTPAQYAAFNTGWQGAGPAWQAFHLYDNSLTYQYQTGYSVFRTTFYNSLYDNPWDRTFQLPNYGYPGSNASWRDTGVNESGFISSNSWLGTNNDFEVGTSYMNDAYFLTQHANDDGSLSSSSSDPYVNETAFFARDVYHPQNSPLAAFANIWDKHASATNTTYVDGRVSVVDRTSSHDVVRASWGSTTTQPSQDMLNKSYLPNDDIIGAGGGAAITCDGLNSIGTVPTSALMPERGVDEELAYTHRWEGDSITQLTLYNTNVFDKLYSTIVSTSQTGTGFIPPNLLQEFLQAVGSKCGNAIAPSLLGLTGNFNVGTLRARGADLSGRARVSRRFYFDYDWALTSSSLLGANLQLLEDNNALIPGSQIARVPLHTANVAADYTIGRGLDLRYTLYTVSAGNSKDLPAYDYSNFSAGYPIGNGVLTGTVLNLFNQYASIAGLIGEGLPLPLNQYARPSAYTPYIGAAATEWFGLPFRSVYFSYQFLVGKP